MWPVCETTCAQGHLDVGVYSYARLGGCLRTLVHLMLHETLHIFGLRHVWSDARAIIVTQ